MSDRALPGVEGPPACPFIAFEDERDERSSSPDHRHRCYAEVQPAPRALAHQEAYCLSSAFPVCPTFQDWARREAAQARSSGRAAVAPPAMSAAINDERESDDDALESAQPVEAEPVVAPVPAASGSTERDGPDDPADDEIDDLAAPSHEDEPVIHRNPPRDWAAPPPWAGGLAAGGSPPASTASGSGAVRAQDRPPGFLASREESRGLAGSAADRLASGSPASSAVPRGASSSPSAPASDELAGLVGAGAAGVGGGARGAPAPISRPPSGAYPTTTASGRRPTVSSTRTRAQQQQHDGPSWESAKRYEAYPTIKTRTGLPGIPRIAIWAGALGVAALALFFLPALLGVGGGGTGASPSLTRTAVVATASPDPTPVPEPTAQTYTLKSGDTLLKVAKRFGLTLDQLVAANKDTIKNPDKVKVGQVIVIPVPPPGEVTDPSAGLPSKTPAP
jgi:LysM repeat protein